ncbi:hypothetical protein SCHPADRAFT_813740, partial [Schizopora paradoxa]
LTRGEQEVLIGMYNVYTNRGPQSSKSSWWPALSVIAGSFLDAGYWTPSCEVWFRNQLEAIASQKQSLKPSNNWR